MVALEKSYPTLQWMMVPGYPHLWKLPFTVVDRGHLRGPKGDSQGPETGRPATDQARSPKRGVAL